MKKIARLFPVILFLAILLPAFPVQGAEDETTLHIVSANDTTTTFDRIIYHMYQRINYNIYIESMSMKLACETANGAEADGVEDISQYVTENYANLALIPEPISKTTFEVYGLDGLDDTFSSWHDLSGLRIGTMYQKLHIQAHLPDDITLLRQYFSFYELNQALLNDEVDVVVTSQGINQNLVPLDGIVHLGTVDSVESFTCLNTSHADLVPALTQALRDMKADGTYDAIINETYRTTDAKKVLHISSYSPEDAWDSALQSAILSIFDESDNVLYYNVPLYSNRYHSQIEIAKNAYSAIRTMTMDMLPDLVIVSDNVALDFVNEYGTQLLGNTPVIYCGITENENYFNTINKHYYGLREYVSALDNVLMIEKLCPDATELFIINDASVTGRAVKQSIQNDLEGYQGRLAVRYNASYDFDDLLAEIQSLPAGTPLMMGTFSSNQQGNTATRQYINHKISETASGPMFSFSSMGNGETGGIRSSAVKQGEAIAAIALEILNGRHPEELYYPSADELIIAEFDWSKLQMHHLSEDNLPANAVLIHAPLSLRDANPSAYYLSMLSIVLFLFLALIATAAYLNARKKNRTLYEAQASLVSLSELQRVNAELSETSARLHLSLSSANSCSWEIDMAKGVIIYDDKMKEILELDRPSPLSLREFSEYYRSIILGAENMQFGDMLNIFAASDNYYNDVECLLPSGTRKYLRYHSQRYIGGEANAVRVFGLIIDSTDHVETANSAREIATRILNSIDEQIYVSDIDTDELLFVNNAMMEAFNIHEYTGQKCWKLFMNHEERCSFCPKNIIAPDSDETYIWENVQPLLNQHTRHMDKYIKWIDGQQVLLHVMFDITDIRNAEQAVQRQYEQQKLVADISASLIQLGEMDELAAQTLERVGQSLCCSRVLLATVTADGQALSPSYEWISPQASNQVRRSRLAPLVPGAKFYEHFVAANEQLVFFPDFSVEKIAGEELGLKSGLASAIYVDSQLAGIFEVTREEAHEWTSNEVRLMQLLSNIFTMLLSRQKIAENLVEAKEAAEQASLAKSQFLSTMSHEIRTPLNSILGLVQILLQKEIAPDFRQRLLEIANASEHLLTIINDVLDMSKIEACKLTLSPAPFSLAEAMEEVVLIFNQRARESDLTFNRTFEGLENRIVLGDKLLLKQVLINLLSNAIKFTHRGGKVFFRVQAMDRDAEQIDVTFQVSDSGIGMDQEQMAKLFTPFEQTRPDISTQYGGTGLGLAISGKLVEIMGGTIQVESQPGNGSKFRFTIPLSLCAPQNTPVLHAVAKQADFSGKTILVVEDIPLNRQILLELLESTGVEFAEAENGREAVDKYIAAPERFDLILMDMLMPVMDGLEATRQIRRLDHLRSTPVPIIALTANAFQEDVDACREAGMMAHISKPIKYHELIEKISGFL